MRLVLATVIAAALFWAAPSQAKPGDTLDLGVLEADLAAICARTKCRPPGVIRVQTKLGPAELKHGGLPFVHSPHVIVLPGESFAVALDLPDTGKGAATVSYAETATPGKTVTVEFETKDSMVLLKVSSQLAVTVKYDAYMRLLPGSGALVYTSSCPVMAGISAFEMWPDSIAEFVLTNFRAIESKTTMRCE